jgi:hypothetical protein
MTLWFLVLTEALPTLDHIALGQRQEHQPQSILASLRLMDASSIDPIATKHRQAHPEILSKINNMRSVPLHLLERACHGLGRIDAITHGGVRHDYKRYYADPFRSDGHQRLDHNGIRGLRRR